MVLSQNLKGYFFTLLLILISGSVVFNWNEIFLVIAFLVSFYFYLVEFGLELHKELLIVLSILIFVTILQTIEFSFFSSWTTAGTLIRFIFPYFAIRVIGEYFPEYYINTMYYIVVLSLVFYIPSNFSTQFFNVISSLPDYLGTSGFGQGTNFLIYTAEPSERFGMLRNSGLFGEPGMFSIYIVIAILFNIISKGELINKINIVFIIALLTTFSTAGYVGLYLAIVFYFAASGKIISYLIIVPAVVIIGWVGYFNIDFMGEKIENEIRSYERGAIYSGRIGSALKDLEDIKDYPIIGRGRNVQTRFDGYAVYDRESELVFHRTNGLTSLAINFGLLFFIVYMYYIFKSFKKFSEYNNVTNVFAFGSLLIVMALGFSQIVMLHSVMIALLFMNVNYD